MWQGNAEGPSITYILLHHCVMKRTRYDLNKSNIQVEYTKPRTGSLTSSLPWSPRSSLRSVFIRSKTRGATHQQQRERDEEAHHCICSDHSSYRRTAPDFIQEYSEQRCYVFYSYAYCYRINWRKYDLWRRCLYTYRRIVKLKNVHYYLGKQLR